MFRRWHRDPADAGNIPLFQGHILITRHYRDILPDGMVIKDKACGPNAISRGNGRTRIVSLCNPTWDPATYTVTIGADIGLDGEGPYEVRRFHPSEEILGSFTKGRSVKVTVPAFRSQVMIVTCEPSKELGVKGCAYEVVRDVPGKPATLKLLGMPGTSARISLPAQPRKFAKATLDGKPAESLLAGKTLDVSFPGRALKQPWHRKLTDLKPVEVPADAGALYEATCYAADNNAMEVRSISRSGPTKLPQVKASRDAFFGQKLLVERGVWDHYLFDNDPGTFFRLSQSAIWDGALRIDMGKTANVDQWVLRNVDGGFKPKEAFVSADLKTWSAVPLKIEPENPVEATVLKGSYSGTKEWQTIQVYRITIDVPEAQRNMRYLKIPGKAVNVGEATAYQNGSPINGTGWRASNVFADYTKAPAKLAWSGSFRLDEAATGSYLVVPCNGKHGQDGAYASLRIDGRWVGAPSRAKAYPANSWETGNGHPDDNFSYFFPVTEDMIGKSIEAVVLQFESEGNPKIPLGKFTSEVWITAYPIPYASRQLVLKE